MTYTTKYNYNEFLAFLLLYASHVDIEYSAEEKTKVKELVSDMEYNKIYNDFINMSDFGALQTIMSYKGVYFPTNDRKNELLSKIQELFYVDGDFSVMEQELIHFLEKLL